MAAKHKEPKGQISNIQRYSISYGPGIRTTVFFQGCPLQCLWCNTPESQPYHKVMMYFEERCAQCGRCTPVCPTGASKMLENKLMLDYRLCINCGACMKACLYGARSMSGKWMTVDEVMQVINKDLNFYHNSGGGVTFSGGECVNQPEFLAALMDRCYQRGIHICMDTTGYVSWDVLEKLLPKVDLVLLEIKHLDSKKHAEYTGVNNELILDNAAKIKQAGKSVIIRMPLIPAHNNSESNLKSLGRFMKLWGFKRMDLLPYHKMGINKALGKEYPLFEVDKLSKDEIRRAVEIMEGFDLETEVVLKIPPYFRFIL